MGEEAAAPPAPEASDPTNFFNPAQPVNMMQNQQQSRQYPLIAPSDGAIPRDGLLRINQPGADSSRYYTIQRVNGNGGNGKGDGTAGPHKHSLEYSDRIKKNSVARHVLKEEKEKKKSQVGPVKIVIAASLFQCALLASFQPARRTYVCVHAKRQFCTTILELSFAPFWSYSLLKSICFLSN